MLLDILNWSHPALVERAEFGTLPLQLMPLLLRHKRFGLSGGETCWGERQRGRESLFKWFRALSLTTPFCTHSATGSGGRGRGDIKGFRNPKKAFKVLLYNADTKAAAAATHCDRRLDVLVPVLRPKRSPSFFEWRAENDFKFS